MMRWTTSISASGQPVRGYEARVVDEHVEAAERALDGADRFGDRARVGDVGDDDEAPTAEALDRRRDFPGEGPGARGSARRHRPRARRARARRPGRSRARLR